MPDQLLVFISYSREDAEIAHQVTEILERGGHRPWIDNQLVPGQRWKDKIEQAIDDCDAFLFLLSPRALNSEYCQWEYSVAVEKQKPLFPVLIKQGTLNYPDELADLQNIQFVDMSGGINAANTASLIGGVFSRTPGYTDQNPGKAKRSTTTAIRQFEPGCLPDRRRRAQHFTIRHGWYRTDDPFALAE